MEDNQKRFDSQMAMQHEQILTLSKDLNKEKNDHAVTKSSLKSELTSVRIELKTKEGEMKKLQETIRRHDVQVKVANESEKKKNDDKEKLITNLNNQIGSLREKEFEQTLQISKMSDKFLYLGITFCLAIVSIFLTMK